MEATLLKRVAPLLLAPLMFVPASASAVSSPTQSVTTGSAQSGGPASNARQPSDTKVAPIRPVQVTASSSDSLSTAPENAVDGDVSSAWRAARAGSAWLELDLGGHYSLRKVQQTFADNEVWRFVVKGSVDGREWATLVDKSAGQSGRTFAEGVNGIFRYIRLVVISSQAGHRASSLDLKVTGTRPIENIAAGQTATASSYKAGYAPTDAFDGNMSSFWAAEPARGPRWLTVDLGQSREVLAVEQNFKDFDTWRFKIEGSLDGEDWTMLADHTAGAKGQSFHLPARGAFRYIRLTIIRLTIPPTPQSAHLMTDEVASGSWADSVELKVFGPASIGERNLASGTAVQSSSLKLGHEPFNAVDNDPKTWWEAHDAATPQSLTVDLGNDSLISSVEQSFVHADGWEFTIEGSRDKTGWKLLVNNRRGAEGRTFRRDVRGTYRYIRVTITGPSGANRPAAVKELKVFGTGSPVRTRWWEDRSGVARFYPVWQGIRLDEITAQLDTLKAQGHSAIELAPIFEGNRDLWAGLGVTNLYNIHPDVGTFEDLRELLDAAHARDMKILFFANPGYAHESAPFFQKALRDFRDGVDSVERSWFDIRSTPGPWFEPWSACWACNPRWRYNEEYDAWYWATWDPRAPSFNFRTQAWREETRKYIRFWMDKGLDGMVLDAPSVYHYMTRKRNNNTLIRPLHNYDTFRNGEGLFGRRFVTNWHYNSLQDYTITAWEHPDNGPGRSTILDAIDSGNPDGIDNVLKSYRDQVVEAGGITQTPPNWGRRDYPVDKRLLEVATLTTMGTLFYVHNDFYTINPIEQEFPHWTDQQMDMFYQLMKVQSSYDALSPTGLRVKLPTNDNSQYYAFLRTNKDGSVKALVVLNFQDSARDVTLDLSNIGISTDQTPIDLARDAAAPAITSSSYTVHVPAYGAVILAVH